MKGLEATLKFSLLSEKKWDVCGFDYRDAVKGLGDEDRRILNALRYVSDGELSGMGILFQLYELCKEGEGNHHFLRFYEAILLGMTVVYDEFRHGMVLRELHSALNGLPSPSQHISAEEVVNGIVVDRPWNDPYEAVVSLAFGEIPTIVIYREAAEAARSPFLKETLLNISRDERRHKTAWREVCKKIVADSEESKGFFLAAFHRAHYVHQAEVGENYVRSLVDTEFLCPPSVSAEIAREKIVLFREILGDDVPLDEAAFLRAEQAHVMRKVMYASPKKSGVKL